MFAARTGSALDSARPRTPSAGRPGGCARMPNAKQGLLLNRHAPTRREISPSATYLPRPRWRRATARCRSARESSCLPCSMFQAAVQPRRRCCLLPGSARVMMAVAVRDTGAKRAECACGRARIAYTAVGTLPGPVRAARGQARRVYTRARHGREPGETHSSPCILPGVGTGVECTASSSGE
jgi:hypothetical protein